MAKFLTNSQLSPPSPPDPGGYSPTRAATMYGCAVPGRIVPVHIQAKEALMRTIALILALVALAASQPYIVLVRLAEAALRLFG